MPLRIGGLNSGLKWTMTPGAGKRKSPAPPKAGSACAKGIAPKVLTKKANNTRIQKDCFVASLLAMTRRFFDTYVRNGVLYIPFKVCNIFILKTRAGGISKYK
jgi:hypothetical protein